MKKIGRLFLWFLFIAMTLLVAVYTYAWMDKLELHEKRSSITIYDVNGNVLYETNFKKNMHWTNIDDIPKSVQEAFVSVEDKRFYYHAGFDPLRIVQAMGRNITSGNILEGGSTITQQYAKNLFLTNEQTMARKVEEFLYAARLEMQYSKEEILEGYLNTLYFGHGVYGVNNAAKYFFNKPLTKLTTAETAMLVGIPNGPSIYSPYLSKENAIKRQQLILQVMVNNDVITEKEKQQAEKEPLQLAVHTDYEKAGNDEYYIDAVIHDLQQRDDIDLGKELHVYTYYDPSVQATLNTSISNHVSLKSELEISGVVMQPFTGNVMALAGGKDYTLSQYNRAIDSKRQVASTIKPLLYYSALKEGFAPSSTFLSEPTTFQIDDKNTYAPKNYAEKYPYKKISMIHAISVSDNIYAVKTHIFLGMETLADSLHAFGIKDAKPEASLALGTVNMSILQLSKIYNTFASEGLYTEPAFISSITDGQGRSLYQHDSKPKRLLDRDETLVLNQMLTATYDNKNVAHTFPTMYGNQPDTQAGVKSGTSDWDALVVGFNPNYTVGIWSGYDDNRALPKADFNISKDIWQETFDELNQGKENVWYQPSDNIVSRKVNPITGKPSNDGSNYWFIRGNEDGSEKLKDD